MALGATRGLLHACAPEAERPEHVRALRALGSRQRLTNLRSTKGEESRSLTGWRNSAEHVRNAIPAFHSGKTTAQHW